MLTFGAIEYLKIDLPGKLPLCELVTPPEYLVPEDYCANKHIINALSEFIQVRESSSQYISCLENDPFADTYSFYFLSETKKLMSLRCCLIYTPHINILMQAFQRSLTTTPSTNCKKTIFLQSTILMSTSTLLYIFEMVGSKMNKKGKTLYVQLE